MKKRSLKNLALNKRKISELQVKSGGRKGPSDDCTASTCTCVATCRPAICDVPMQADTLAPAG